MIIDQQGRLWWTTAEACAQLGVTPENLRDWVRRSKRGHGFPTVDPPVRRGRSAAYRAQQLMDAEAYTATSTRGNRRA